MFYAINTAMQMGCNRVMFETDSTQLKTAVTIEDYDLAALGAIFIKIINFICVWFLLMLVLYPVLRSVTQ